jgi:hypothetical protein
MTADAVLPARLRRVTRDQLNRYDYFHKLREDAFEFFMQIVD